MLHLVGVPDAAKHRTQDFRRGHNQDMLAAGSTLAEALLAGEWRSVSGWKPYVHGDTLEADAVMQAHYQESSEDEAWGLDDWPT